MVFLETRFETKTSLERLTQVHALQDIVGIQEQEIVRLAGASTVGGPQMAKVGLLTRWRQEAFRVLQEKLQLQLQHRQARDSWNASHDALEQQLQATQASAQVLY